MLSNHEVHCHCYAVEVRNDSRLGTLVQRLDATKVVLAAGHGPRADQARQDVASALNAAGPSRFTGSLCFVKITITPLGVRFPRPVQLLVLPRTAVRTGESDREAGEAGYLITRGRLPGALAADQELARRILEAAHAHAKGPGLSREWERACQALIGRRLARPSIRPGRWTLVEFDQGIGSIRGRWDRHSTRFETARR